MGLEKLERVLYDSLQYLKQEGRLKGKEFIITRIRKAEGEEGPRYFLRGMGEKPFIRMNSNSYLGLSLNPEVITAGEEAVRQFGTGPGAVRFISGTFQPHRNLEQKLAKFHQRDDAIIFNSAYTAVLGVLSSLISGETIVISDELNHNSIINVIRLSRPAEKYIYSHLNIAELEEQLKKSIGWAKRVIIVTDGVFSMRGDYAPLDEICQLARKYEHHFLHGVIVVVDDSHGIGCFGATGRGTEEYTQAEGIDVLIGTLGKAFGVNGGYATSSQTVITYLRENAPIYIYSNPITVAEATAASKVLEILESKEGIILLDHLAEMTRRFEVGLIDLGYEIIESNHPIVPLMVRDTIKTEEMVNFLIKNGILATGLKFPVVPPGDEEIRFQINASHTPYDIDAVIDVLKKWKEDGNGCNE